MGDFEEFVRDIIDLISHEEQNRLYEMELWIMNGEGVWVLDDSYIAFIGMKIVYLILVEFFGNIG